MSTFLQLVQQFYREVGFSGAVPTTVTDQVSQKKKAVDWVAESEYVINSKWVDWDYLWAQRTLATVIGTSNYSAPSDIGTYDVESFYLDYTTDDFAQLRYLPYKEWRRQFRQGSKTNAQPDMFTIFPDNTIQVEAPPDAIYNLTHDYWQEPTKMTGDTDTSPIPVRFERIIIERAKIFYAKRYGDTTLLQLASGEYGEMLDRLEADQRQDRYDKHSQSHNFVTVVE